MPNAKFERKSDVSADLYKQSDPAPHVSCMPDMPRERATDWLPLLQ